jgi:uncharacterized repeat protein (TIGR03803 family)
MADLTTGTNEFDYTGQIVTVTVGQAGDYQINAEGAAGGSGYSHGGEGAQVQGDIYLEAGAKLEIVVGAEGSAGPQGGGGGGGSFVLEYDASTQRYDIDLFIAGGGGGGGYALGGAGGGTQAAGFAGNGAGAGAGGAGGQPGAGGYGGGGGETGGQGGGSGRGSAGSDAGTTFAGGAAVRSSSGTGGFGGGGGGGGPGGGGGGGGYGGGGGGGSGGGGGGGSYVASSAVAVTKTAAANPGAGHVTIQAIPTTTVLVNFDDGNGQGPVGALLLDGKGDLFGATINGGGPNEQGLIYELSPTRSGYQESIVYNFNGGDAEGGAPAGNLIADSKGDTFGTASGGAGGAGLVFELTPGGQGGYTEHVLHEFSGPDGDSPNGGVTADAKGDLFGVAASGGAGGDGVVYELTPDGQGGYAEQTVHDFTGTGEDGIRPEAGVTVDANGNLFGTTASGGADGEGTVFELTPQGAGGYTEHVIHAFTGAGDDGAYPGDELAFGPDGELFGATSFGGSADVGTVFELTPDQAGGYTEQTIYSFSAEDDQYENADGAYPDAGVTVDANGDVFGTASDGGSTGNGVVFELVNTDGQYEERTVHNFTGHDGGGPDGPVIADAQGDLYGTTSLGYGNVYEIQNTGFAPDAPCYCPGTLILTDRGEVSVENLSIGDRLVTGSGEAKAVKWIGRRSYAGRFVAANRRLLPVCVRAGAMGAGLPRRDLWVSPLHAMVVDGCLVPAGALVNGVSVVQASEVEEVRYIHLELAEHSVIYAEGAASESFVDDDSRAMFQNAHTFAELYPDARPAPAVYCLPRVEDGEALERLRAVVDGYAGLDRTAPTAPRLKGHVDRAADGLVEGWAQAEGLPEAPVCLDVLVDGVVAATVLANRHRSDLERAGLGSGRHAFSVALDLPFGARVEVRRSLDGARLPQRKAAQAA